MSDQWFKGTMHEKESMVVFFKTVDGDGMAGMTFNPRVMEMVYMAEFTVTGEWVLKLAWLNVRRLISVVECSEEDVNRVGAEIQTRYQKYLVEQTKRNAEGKDE